MSKWKVSEMDSKSNSYIRPKVQPITAGSKAGLQLKRLGMSDTGIRQLSSGQPVNNKNDQAIIARIISEALG
ncbi:MAG: hypothetical protein HKN25_08710 [Pyrinomonadaceae bacterium]|nr:hypothetical protein [Pyrinomonadaceae bacterium]